MPHSTPVFAALPPRPFYREPHPITTGAVISGLAATALWFALFGSLGDALGSYAWWTIGAAAVAWAVALLLAVLGDRGVAVGVAVASGFGLSIALFFVTLRWYHSLDWPLW
ncbi:hypothetical protein MB27_38430 [Actinoplanes utahensis]|uniref:Uncharacterized protein n=1 Tax=Actinoplanes utahensis TaxID=1869 RepID=A0A0A6UCL8_ACTUT|nr:hypothetical protein MB27_38430 [Actinoplanes utahensis]